MILGLVLVVGSGGGGVSGDGKIDGDTVYTYLSIIYNMVVVMRRVGGV